MSETKDVWLDVGDGSDPEPVAYRIPPASDPNELPSLKPDDRGGPTSTYQGPIGGILEISVIYDNVTNGRPPKQGLV